VIDLLVTRIKCIRESLFELSEDIIDCAHDLEGLMLDVANQVDRSREQMKQFEEGFAYERPKTPSTPRKKPVLHGVEPKRNKRKSEQDARSNDSTK